MKKFIQIAGFATVLCVSGRGPVKFKTKCFAFLLKSFVLSIDYFSYFPLSVTFPQILLKLIGKPEVKVFLSLTILAVCNLFTKCYTFQCRNRSAFLLINWSLSIVSKTISY